jgi:hypothetical protein
MKPVSKLKTNTCSFALTALGRGFVAVGFDHHAIIRPASSFFQEKNAAELSRDVLTQAPIAAPTAPDFLAPVFRGGAAPGIPKRFRIPRGRDFGRIM